MFQLTWFGIYNLWLNGSLYIAVTANPPVVADPPAPAPTPAPARRGRRQPAAALGAPPAEVEVEGKWFSI